MPGTDPASRTDRDHSAMITARRAARDTRPTARQDPQPYSGSIQLFHVKQSNRAHWDTPSRPAVPARTGAEKVAHLTYPRPERRARQNKGRHA